MFCWASIPSIWFPFHDPVAHNEPLHRTKLAAVFSAVWTAVYGPAITPGWQSPDWQLWPTEQTLANTHINSTQFLMIIGPSILAFLNLASYLQGQFRHGARVEERSAPGRYITRTPQSLRIAL
jgi:hypothetical protein